MEADKQIFLETCKFLGIKDDHIEKLYDTNYGELLLFRSRIEGKFKNAQETKTNILYILWYGGHGEMYDGSTTTQILLNSLVPG